MKISKLQILEIASSFESHGDESSWYWDKKTSQVLLNCPEEICGMDLEEQGFDEDPDENENRYIYIEPVESHEGYRNMESYLATLPDGECQRALDRALRGRKPFATFKHTLYDFPEEREAWFAYHNNWLEQKAREFIQHNKLGEIEE